jgi:hypothetical protein
MCLRVKIHPLVFGWNNYSHWLSWTLVQILLVKCHGQLCSVLLFIIQCVMHMRAVASFWPLIKSKSRNDESIVCGLNGSVSLNTLGTPGVYLLDPVAKCFVCLQRKLMFLYWTNSGRLTVSLQNGLQQTMFCSCLRLVNMPHRQHLHRQPNSGGFTVSKQQQQELITSSWQANTTNKRNYSPSDK